MKNKIILFIINFIIFAFIFSNCYANENTTIYLKTNKKSFEINEEFEVSLFINNAKTSAFISHIYFDNSKIEYVSGSENSNIINNQIIHIWYDETGNSVQKEGELAKFKFRAKETGDITFFIEGEFYDNSEKKIETNFENLNIEITSNDSKEEVEKVSTEINNDNNANLENLVIENILLYPAFDPNITNYNAEISNEVSNLNILAVPEIEDSQVQISGNENLVEGENLIEIVVISSNGISKKTYQINVKKRNEVEQKVYEETQLENSQKLEKIYQTEKLSQERNETEEPFDVEKQNSENKKIEFLFSLLVVAFVIAIMLVIKKISKK